MKYYAVSASALAAALLIGAAARAEPFPADPADNASVLFVGEAHGGASATRAAPEIAPWGFDESGMDRQVKPGDSFFDYANGAWYARTEVPPDKSRYGAFNRLADRTEEQLRTLIESDAARHAPPHSTAGKIAAAWASFMDEARLETLDDQPIRPDLARVTALSSKSELAAFMGQTHGRFGQSLFRAFVGTDAKNPEANALHASTAGLGLPDRDYYVNPIFAPKKAAYRAYVAKMLAMIGWPGPEAHADQILAFETAVAEASWTRAQQREREKTYNPMTPAALAAYAPGFEWGAWFDAAGFGKVDRVIVAQNTAFPAIAKIYADTPLDTLKAWEAFHIADQTAPYLSKRFADANFQFRQAELSGQKEQRARWKRGVTLTSTMLGEAVGREYVGRYFTAESKQKMDALVAELRVSLRHRIEHLDWMSEPTRQKALEKLDLFKVKIGYPAKWRDYSALKLDPTDLVGNVRRSSEFEWRRRASRLGKPVDHAEWGMTPQTVNAQYNSVDNDITFPAAILQAPFFDPKADMAVNYGAIGVVIGHEMTHGFDDQGRKSNGHGKLTDWWQAVDAEKFRVQAAKYGAQFDSYEVAPGVHVKGAQTMGENIGDLGGVLVALDAWHASLKGRPAPVLDGLTGDQRFFLGMAQVWREKATMDALKQQTAVDVHSPARFRINGPMRNVDAWYDAWGVKPGDALYLKPEDRVRIW